MCIDYRRINKLQPEVTNADGGKGCISLIPLPKIDELYAKLKGYKVFSMREPKIPFEMMSRMLLFRAA